MDDQSVHLAVPLDSSSAQALEGLSDEEFWSYAQQLAHSTADNPLAAQYLECRLGDGLYLLPLSSLSEIVPAPYHFAQLPSMPTWMIGIVAWHGEIIAVIDLAAYLIHTASANPSLGMNEEAKARRYLLTAEGLLLVVHAEGRLASLGLLVSEVGLTTTIAAEQAERALQEDAGVLWGRHGEAWLINGAALFADVLEQIRIAAFHG